MEKYFSSAVCRRGCCAAYRTIYKNDTAARVFLLADGNDTERAVFFRRLEKNLAGYRVSLFNPFYDDAPDGIHIKNPNVYILSDGGYGKIAPALPGGWEQYISIAEKKSYPPSLRKEILSYKAAENEAYKKGGEALRRAADIREKLHGEISLRLDDEKLINFIRRFCLRTFRNAEAKGTGTVRLLSSPTPLGIHTHWDTVFNSCETVISVRDEAGFVSSVILGIIKDYAVSEKLPFIISPSYFLGEIPQLLLFPSLSLAVVGEDSSHILPFSAAETVNGARFLKKGGESEKSAVYRELEDRMLDKCVTDLYEGRELRKKYNGLLKPYTDTAKALESADKLSEKILS